MLASLHRPSFVLICCYNSAKNLSSFATRSFFIPGCSVRTSLPLRSLSYCSPISKGEENLIPLNNAKQPKISNQTDGGGGHKTRWECKSRVSGIKPGQISPIDIKFMSTSRCSSPAVEQVLVENDVQLLSAINDDHGGVIVEMKDPMESDTFASILRASLLHWRRQGKRGVWIKLPIELVNLVEAAVKQGFGYHHAEPQYLMLIYWIPESVNTLPANASHRVGIGAFVMNEKGEVLVVQENSGKFRGSGVWKFPTGVVDEGEDICAAAVREVKEETGIDSEFVEVLAFRQSHQSFFEKSDLFFLCMLRPLSFNIQKQESEIEAAEWMPFEEYAAQPFVQKHDLFRNIIDICMAKRGHTYSGFSPVPTTSSFSAKANYLYLNNQDLNNH